MSEFTKQGDALSDLPQELLAELRFPKSIETLLIETLAAAGGPMTINEILVATYRAKGKVLKRERVHCALSMLHKVGKIQRVPNAPSGTYVLIRTNSQ